MAAPTFPYGYQRPPEGGEQGLGTMLSFAQLLERTTVARMHPEFRRRVFALMQDARDHGIKLGIGTGWRDHRASLDPNGNVKPGFAPPGNSNHESFPARSDAPNAVAADMVPGSAWGYMDSVVHRYGLRTFRHVNNEPWHIQPAEIPASRNHREHPWTLTRWPLPPRPHRFRPGRGRFGLWPIYPDKPTLRLGATGPAVRYAKGVLKLHVARFAAWFAAHERPGPQRRRLRRCARRCAALDPANPRYTRRTLRAVRAAQAAFGLTADGIVGRGQTWPWIDSLSDGIF